ncbi:MAG: serine hydrolase [Rhodanobacter sp.]
MIPTFHQRACKGAAGWLAASCVAVALLSFGAIAEPSASVATPMSLDAFAHKAMQTFDTPGMAVTVVENETITTHTYGVRKLGEAAKVDAHTVFSIGSNTKAFTATALAMLVDQGKLHWDDRLVDKLPGFRMYDPYASAEMTVTDLLVHRSGLGLGEGDLLLMPSTDRSRDEVMHAIRYLKPAHSFRADYDYDNVLYVVAGQLVQAVSGQRWEDYVQQHILDPLGMRDSQTSFDARVPDQAAWHAKIGGPLRGVGKQSLLVNVLNGDAAAPAGGLQLSALDMGRWLRVQLRHGELADGKRLFSEAASTALWTPHTLIPIDQQPPPLALAQPQFQAYAFGFEVSDYRGHKIISHDGGVLGGISEVVLIPEKQVAFAIMLNSEDVGTLLAVRQHLLDVTLGLSSPDWIANYKQVLDQRHAQAIKLLQAAATPAHASVGPSLPLSRYAGVYRDSWYGTATIGQTKGGLTIRFDRSPGMHGTLEHVQYDTFRTHWDRSDIEDAYVTFALTAEGGIDHISMKAVSPLADFSYDYQDLHFVPERSGK